MLPLYLYEKSFEIRPYLPHIPKLCKIFAYNIIILIHNDKFEFHVDFAT